MQYSKNVHSLKYILEKNGKNTAIICRFLQTHAYASKIQFKYDSLHTNDNLFAWLVLVRPYLICNSPEKVSNFLDLESGTHADPLKTFSYRYILVIALTTIHYMLKLCIWT